MNGQTRGRTNAWMDRQTTGRTNFRITYLHADAACLRLRFRYAYITPWVSVLLRVFTRRQRFVPTARRVQHGPAVSSVTRVNGTECRWTRRVRFVGVTAVHDTRLRYVNAWGAPHGPTTRTPAHVPVDILTAGSTMVRDTQKS